MGQVSGEKHAEGWGRLVVRSRGVGQVSGEEQRGGAG